MMKMSKKTFYPLFFKSFMSVIYLSLPAHLPITQYFFFILFLIKQI